MSPSLGWLTPSFKIQIAEKGDTQDLHQPSLQAAILGTPAPHCTSKVVFNGPTKPGGIKIQPCYGEAFCILLDLKKNLFL